MSELLNNSETKTKLHKSCFRMYGDSCFLVYVNRKQDCSVPLSQYEYYWSMRIPGLSSDDCIALLFTGADVSDYILDIELCMGAHAYVSSAHYFCEISCCKIL